MLTLFRRRANLALLVTIGMTMMAGIYVERLCFRMIPQEAALASMVSSFAIWMQLDELVIQSPWSQTYAYPFPSPVDLGTLELGIEGIWIGLCAEFAGRAGLFAARFFHGGWKRVKV